MSQGVTYGGATYRPMEGYTIDPVKRDLWSAALRSGQYLQGFSALTLLSVTGSRHCCLGVASELAADAGAVVRVPDESANIMRYQAPGEVHVTGEGYLLSPEVWSWLGLEGSDGYSNNHDIKIVANYPGGPVDWVWLASLNDKRIPFNVIADIIDLIPATPTAK